MRICSQHSSPRNEANVATNGVSPQAAQIFVSLGHGLGELRCLPNLKEGLRHCLAARRSPLAARGPG